MKPFFLLARTKHIDNECTLMRIAAYLWECEEIIWAALKEQGYGKD